MHGPVLTAKRVTLRPHRQEDAPDFVRMLSNPHVTRWLQRTTPPTLEQEQAWIAAREHDPNSIGWSIELDGLCIGSVGFDEIDWHNQWATVGIFIGHPEIWGTGIGHEVALLADYYAFIDQPWRLVKSGYLAPNVASEKLQASIGLREVGRWPGAYWRDGQYVDHVLTALTREERDRRYS